MITAIIYSVMVLIAFGGLYLWSKKQVDFLSFRSLAFGLGVKLGYGIIYVYLFTWYFSDGQIFGDSFRFLADGKAIHDIAYSNFSVFLKVITGWVKLTPEEAATFLSETTIWDYGNNGDWINDNRLIIRINALIHFISLGNIYIHALIFSILSFCGSLLIYKAFSPIIKHQWFWTVLVCWPGINFWGSGILKESILLFAIGLFFYQIEKMRRQKRFKLSSLVLLTIAVLLLTFNKPYAGLMIIGTVLLYRSLSLFIRQTAKPYVILLTLTGLFGIALFAPGPANMTEKISAKQNDLINLGKGGIAIVNDTAFCVFPYNKLSHFNLISDSLLTVEKPASGEYKVFGEPNFKPFLQQAGPDPFPIYLIYPPSGSYFETTPIQYSPWQLIQNIPMAVINVLIRPFPTDKGDPLKYLVFCTNLTLLAGLILALYYKKPTNLIQKEYLTIFLTTSLLTILIIGLTIPIFGAIVRYKMPVELYLILIAFILISPNHENQPIP